MSERSPHQSISAARAYAMLQSAMGPDIAAALADPLTQEVMVNPDGRLRIDRLGEGCSDTGIIIPASQCERIIRLVASHIRAEVTRDCPVISAELPPHGTALAGERFEGLLPPVSAAPCFAIRKPATRSYTLGDYVTDGLMSVVQADQLRDSVAAHHNILIAGGTSSGKTTLANALLAEMAATNERIIIIEDTRELQCAAPDTVALRTKSGLVSMADLVRSTLRLRPDRIIVGEVRGGALSGGRAIAGAGMGAIRAGTAMGSAASTAYKLGQETSGSNSVGAGLGGMATAAKGAAANKMSGAFGISGAAEQGRSAAWEAGVTRSNSGSSTASSSAANGSSSVSQAAPQADAPPAWAGQMRRDAANRTYRHAAIQSIKEGDRGGASATPDIKDKDD